jgi:hypothetical protein
LAADCLIVSSPLSSVSLTAPRFSSCCSHQIGIHAVVAGDVLEGNLAIRVLPAALLLSLMLSVSLVAYVGCAVTKPLKTIPRVVRFACPPSSGAGDRNYIFGADDVTGVVLSKPPDCLLRVAIAVLRRFLSTRTPSSSAAADPTQENGCFLPPRRSLGKIGASPPPTFWGIEISKVACGQVTLWPARDRNTSSSAPQLGLGQRY